MEPLVLALVIWLLAMPIFLVLWFMSRRKLARVKVDAEKQELESNALLERFKPILSVEQEVATLTDQASEIRNKTDSLRTEYATKRKVLSRLEEQMAIYDDCLAFAELGMYEPHFDFDDSETYKEQIKQIRTRQKTMVSAKNATICPANWTVDGSRAKGQTMVNRQMRLTMRAFNNECEAAIAKTRWNNVVAMEKRILNAVKAIDKENTSMSLEVNEEYVALKLDELFLTHEYRERLKLEKDERTELARSEREEKKLLAEADRAEREERKYQAQLEKMRKEAGIGEASDELKRKISELEAALQEAHETGERARAMAEMTKSGYVYIISNVGSFGEDILKIGLTRRLNPDDRVRELGDASVPFVFDTHAMIYSDEAPALEAALHKEFSERRVNMANMRKEFFRVSLDEIQEAVTRLAPDAAFFKDRDAQDWNETMARRNQSLKEETKRSNAEFPDTI